MKVKNQYLKILEYLHLILNKLPSIQYGIQGFIRHILNYTEYNQQWNVSQVRSMDNAIIYNTTQENIHKYRYKIRIKIKEE